MTTGCLMEDPPPYTQPKQTPPRLDQKAATPSIDQVIVQATNDLIVFTMPVASEDAGDDISGYLFLDYSGGTTAELIAAQTIPPSTLDDQSDRVLTLPWVVRPGLRPGCHRLTLRVSHQTNFRPFPDFPEVFDPDDLAEAYWWANLNPEPPIDTLANCPLASSGEP